MAKPITRRNLLKTLGYGAASAVLVAGLGDVESRWLSVEHRELILPKWDADGFRVAVVADFHANKPTDVARAQEALRLAIAEKPDLIALPGDFIDTSSQRGLDNVREALSPLSDAKCPVVATLGNHDYWTKDPSKVIATLHDMPLKLLRNESVEVAGVTVAGIDDATANRQLYGFLNSGHQSKSLLALFHEPDFVIEVPEHISLQVSGHSHGGQICLPGGIPLHTPGGAHRYYSGYYADARVPLFVTRGVGTTGPDIRLFCRPEVSILTLRGA